MSDEQQRQQLVDRYLREELSPQQETDFELRLMHDSALQTELEATLAIRQGLREAAAQEETRTQDGAGPAADHPISGSVTAGARRNSSPWTGLALAASVLIAVVSGGMLWQMGEETAAVHDRLQALEAPRGVLTVRVDIMRSGCDGTPGTIAELPTENGTVILDIELSPAFRNESSVAFRLSGKGSGEWFVGNTPPASDGRVRLAFASELLPVSVARLELKGVSSDLDECRLIEFRSPGEADQ